MTKEEAKKIYEQLFADPNDKAEAFDKLAEMYYYSNFGTASKTEIDTLMFSLYLEQILNVSQGDFSSYSDAGNHGNMLRARPYDQRYGIAAA